MLSVATPRLLGPERQEKENGRYHSKEKETRNEKKHVYNDAKSDGPAKPFGPDFLRFGFHIRRC
jgi:hypothetical protein